jgi:hypothetical protein
MIFDSEITQHIRTHMLEFQQILSKKKHIEIAHFLIPYIELCLKHYFQKII